MPLAPRGRPRRGEPRVPAKSCFGERRRSEEEGIDGGGVVGRLAVPLRRGHGRGGPQRWSWSWGDDDGLAGRVVEGAVVEGEAALVEEGVVATAKKDRVGQA